MGNVIPDRFFWALPPAENEDNGAAAKTDEAPAPEVPTGSRRVH